MPDILILIADIAGISIMGGVGVSGIKYFGHLLREDDLKNLRYIWVPNVISYGFFFALISALFINDVFGTFRSPFYLAIHSFLLVGSAFFGLGMYRFTKTIKAHIESKKKAAVSLEQMQGELTKRLQDARK
ncbi:MAG TPA: hypothetical protein VNE86_07105 [Nitrososphaerales archaeon]|nr:hypothetical protein [Nitrososphaerales archaeon]